jgi:hypothetical protein
MSSERRPAVRYESKTTHQLCTGDLVAEHGCVWRLVGQAQRPHPAGDPDSGVRWWHTELVSFTAGEIPRHWAETWIIQGNETARWRVVCRP